MVVVITYGFCVCQMLELEDNAELCVSHATG
jgi:hypothetical protein